MCQTLMTRPLERVLLYVLTSLFAACGVPVMICLVILACTARSRHHCSWTHVAVIALSQLLVSREDNWQSLRGLVLLSDCCNCFSSISVVLTKRGLIFYKQEYSQAEAGWKLWRSAWLPAERLIGMQEKMHGKSLLELGSGCGLCGLFSVRPMQFE